MNKARRQEIKRLKYKKRLKKMGLLSHNTLALPKGTEDGIYVLKAQENKLIGVNRKLSN